MAATYLGREVLRELSVLDPKKTAFAIAFDWAIIALSIVVSIWADNWPVYILAVLVIAGRQHALGVLIHDFAHYRFLRNKRLSEWIGDMLLAWPILITINSYRSTHMEHHFHTNTDKDPDYVNRRDMKAFSFPMNMWYLARRMAGYLVAITSINDILTLHTKKIANNQTRGYVWARLGFYAIIGLIIGATGVWREFLLYWAVPYFTFFFAFNYIRNVAEHFCAMDYSTLETGTRTVIQPLWEAAFFAPHNVNLHCEHHLYPGVPFYNLPKLHEKLMQNDDYRKTVHITYGYTTGLLGEVLRGYYKRPRHLAAMQS